jgi:hypothetical protein
LVCPSHAAEVLVEHEVEMHKLMRRQIFSKSMSKWS